jgi:hypothetical protein
MINISINKAFVALSKPKGAHRIRNIMFEAKQIFINIVDCTQNEHNDIKIYIDNIYSKQNYIIYIYI